MRLGGPVLTKPDSPASWVAAVGAEGYKAAFCPIGPEADQQTIRAYAAAAQAADIVIEEAKT